MLRTGEGVTFILENTPASPGSSVSWNITPSLWRGSDQSDTKGPE